MKYDMKIVKSLEDSVLLRLTFQVTTKWDIGRVDYFNKRFFEL